MSIALLTAFTYRVNFIFKLFITVSWKGIKSGAGLSHRRSKRSLAQAPKVLYLLSSLQEAALLSLQPSSTSAKLLTQATAAWQEQALAGSAVEEVAFV